MRRAQCDRRAPTGRPKWQPVQIRATPFSEIAKTDPEVSRVADLVRDPVGRACREEIKRLGKLLFRVAGSTDAMRESQERVADMEPAKAGRRLNLLDKWWNGVGAGRDFWWA